MQVNINVENNTRLVEKEKKKMQAPKKVKKRQNTVDIS